MPDKDSKLEKGFPAYVVPMPGPDSIPEFPPGLQPPATTKPGSPGAPAQQPAKPGSPGAPSQQPVLPPVQPDQPIFILEEPSNPINLPPGHVWPPLHLTGGQHGKGLALVWMPGNGWTWVVVELEPDPHGKK
jgi:hypothetical protein